MVHSVLWQQKGTQDTDCNPFLYLDFWDQPYPTMKIACYNSLTFIQERINHKLVKTAQSKESPDLEPLTCLREDYTLVFPPAFRSYTGIAPLTSLTDSHIPGPTGRQGSQCNGGLQLLVTSHSLVATVLRGYSVQSLDYTDRSRIFTSQLK